MTRLARYHDMEVEVVWCGADRHVTLSGDYVRYPDQISAAAPEQQLGPGRRRAGGVCLCGCGRAVTTDRRYARGHHPARARGPQVRGQSITVSPR